MTNLTKKEADELPEMKQQQTPQTDEVKALRAEINKLKALLRLHTGKDDYE